jgi:hypothetical protein
LKSEQIERTDKQWRKVTTGRRVTDREEEEEEEEEEDEEAVNRQPKGKSK